MTDTRLTDPFDDPAHWHARAEEARTLADQMKHDEKSRQAYERMAKHAEERARRHSDGRSGK